MHGGTAILRYGVDLHDAREKRLALEMDEAGQAHDARQIMHHRISAEASGDTLLQRRKILTVHLKHETTDTPVGVPAAG